MKVIVLYNFNSDAARSVEEFEHEYEARTGRELDCCDTETKEGADLAKLYDITSYPAVIATTNDGQMLQLWQNDLPLINEVMFYDKTE